MTRTLDEDPVLEHAIGIDLAEELHRDSSSQQHLEAEDRITFLEKSVKKLIEDAEEFRIKKNTRTQDVNEGEREKRTTRRSQWFLPRALFSSMTNRTRVGYLDADTYTMMMLAKTFFSVEWIIGFISFCMQILLVSLVVKDQLTNDFASTTLGMPIRVSWSVKLGQFCAILVAMMTQTDVLTPVRNIAALAPMSSNRWEEPIGDTEKNRSILLWLKRVLLPNLLKLTQGTLVIFSSWVVVVQSDNIIDLLKDFTALNVISSIDDLWFSVAYEGFLGCFLSNKAHEATDVKVEAEPRPGEDNREVLERRRVGFLLQSFLLIIYLAAMLGGWGYVLNLQIQGDFVMQKYPLCFVDEKFEDTLINVEWIGNGRCDGEPYNSIACGYDGGDCNDINERLPRCDTDKPWTIGDGVCNLDLNTDDCGFDYGDCIERNKERDDLQCILEDKAINGTCDFNEYDDKYGISDFFKCQCNINYTEIIDTNLDRKFGFNLALANDANHVAVGGVINAMNTTVIVYDKDPDNITSWRMILDVSEAISNFGYYERFNGDLIPQMAFSSDGKKLIIGEPGYNGTGAAFIFLLEENKWTQMGTPLLGRSNGDGYGSGVAITANGSRVAVGAYEGAYFEVVDWSVDADDWNRENSFNVTYEDNTTFFGWGIAMSSDGTKIVVGARRDDMNGYNSGSVYFYKIDNGLKLMNRMDGNGVNQYFSWSVTMSGDGRRAAAGINRGDYVKVYTLNRNETAYIELGDDIVGSPGSKFGHSLSLSEDGDQLVIGAPNNNDAGRGSGKVFIYSLSTYGWNLAGEYGGDVPGHNFGYSVSISGGGSHLLVGTGGFGGEKGNGTVKVIG